MNPWLMRGANREGSIDRYGETRLLTKEDVVGKAVSTNVVLDGGMEAPGRCSRTLP